MSRTSNGFSSHISFGGTSGVAEMAPRERISTRRWLHERIYDRILTGELRPSSKLQQQQLAEEYKVGQGMVREALLLLQQLGLVEVVENRGFFVSQMNAEKLLEAYELRELHDGLAARRCCGRITPDQVEELQAMARRIHQLGLEDQEMEMGLLDRAWHDRLVEISGNNILSRLTENYCFVLRKFIWDWPHRRRDLEQTLDWHTKILAAIRENRPEEAERLAREHVYRARLDLEERIQKGQFQYKISPKAQPNEQDSQE
jgi:DNA-binding GntR family transcriptional regulator